jgi:DNA (cytosine-5)-methyltransferase 1
MAKTPLNFIDLFSGAGGLSCGLELAGMKCLLGVDHNKDAMKTFAHNHRQANTYCGDIGKLSIKQIRELTGHQEIHCIVGGPPCQGFSTVGTGNPLDIRNQLFLQYHRLVKALNPQFFVIENVTGLVAKKNEKTLNAIIKFFTRLGYEVEVRVLSAHEFGVAEHRRRTIIMGAKQIKKVIFPVAKNNLTLTIADAWKSLKADSPNHDVASANIKSKIDLERIKKIPEGCGIRYAQDEKAYLPHSLKLGINWDQLPEGRFRQTKYFRLNRQKPAPTIMTHRHTYYHPTEHRFLTAREAAAIQSFPHDFTFFGSVSSQWKQIGNAVPPMLAKSLGQAILQMHQESLKPANRVIKKNLSNKTDSQIAALRSRAFEYSKT